jgi:hypothetical protein
MKVFPIVTALLVVQTLFLNHVIGRLIDLHFTVYKQLAPLDRTLLDANTDWLQRAGLCYYGFRLLSLAFIIIDWRNHLSHRWIITAISILWVAISFTNCSSRVY